MSLNIFDYHRRQENDNDENDSACEAEDLSMPFRKRTANESPNYSEHEESYSEVESVTIEMEIQEPMSKLKSLVEEKLNRDLSAFIICLQDRIRLDLSSSLGEQCIQENGRAEIKMEVKRVGKMCLINILDVLRLLEDDVEMDDDEECSNTNKSYENNNKTPSDDRSDASSSNSDLGPSSPIPFPWSILHDINSIFPLPLPNDPSLWTEEHTQQWLRWAIKEYGVKFVDDSMWNLSGKQLAQMTEEEFKQKVPLDPKRLFWTHTELLRKCQIFAVPDKGKQQRSQIKTVGKSIKKAARKPRTPSSSSSVDPTTPKRTSMTGHNGQIQLWQFLLELLGDKNSKSVIQWVGREGEFKLNDPELVAQMWGQRKNKPKMNYEKLSRALRYYYSEAMIAKVHGRRFVYKFVCNLKELVGYSTEELINLVEDEPLSYDDAIE